MPGAVEAEGAITFTDSVVPVARYGAFRELMAGLDRAVARRVTAAPVSASSSPRSP